APETPLEPAVAPSEPRLHAAQTEEHKPDSQHAVYPEQSRVSMKGSEIESLHVIERKRRIDQEAEQSRAYEIPEGDGDEEHHGPPVAPHPGGCLAKPIIVISLKADVGERND